MSRNTASNDSNNNHYSLYTAVVYFSYATLLPAALTGLNWLACYAPNPKQSLGRVILGRMGWEENAVLDDDISTSALIVIPPSLFATSLCLLLATHCTAQKPTQREERQLSAGQHDKFMFHSRIQTLATMSHTLIGTNTPLIFIGLFLYAFFASKNELAAASYMSLAAGFGTTILTALGYCIYAIAKIFMHCCAAEKIQLTQLAQETQTIENIADNRSSNSGHVVIEMHPPGHQRIPSDVVDDVTTRVFERVHRRTADGQTFPGPQRVVERRRIQFADHEELEAERVSIEERRTNPRAIIPPTQPTLPGHVSSDESFAPTLSP